MASILNSFESIPKEILGRIVSYLDSNASLLRLSSTCHYLRHTLAPRAFSKVKVQFSAAGLARLAQLSKLDIFRQNVEALLYDVVEIIDPAVQNREAFETTIYPPTEYVSDQADDLWNVSKTDLRYEQIWTTLNELCIEQQQQLDRSHDMNVLSMAFSSLENLQIFTLRFASVLDRLHPAFEHIMTRVTKDTEFSTQKHLVTAFQPFLLSQKQERRARGLKIEGDWGTNNWNEWDCNPLLRDTFSSSKELSIAGNQAAFDYVCALTLPELTCLRLTSLRLCLKEFLELVRSRALLLSTLHLDDVVLSLDEASETYAFTPHTVPSKRLLQAVERIGKCGRLKRATITGYPRHQIADRSCFQDLFCGKVEISLITPGLIESLTPADGDE